MEDIELLGVYGDNQDPLSDQWDLEEDWKEEYPHSYKISILHSKNYTGFLRQVSRDVGGWPMRMVERSTEISEGLLAFTLLGCFVGTELSPRFLAILNSLGRYTFYTSEGTCISPNIENEMHDKVFNSNLKRLRTRLWKI